MSWSSKDFDSIGLMKKNMMVDELLEMADKMNIHPGFLATFYEKILKITEKFLEIEKKLSALEGEKQ